MGDPGNEAADGGGASDRAGPRYCRDCVVDTIVCGQTVQGNLASDDCELDDASYIDVWRLEVGEPRNVTISLSATFDTYLRLGNPRCVEPFLAENDDCGDTLSSCLELYLSIGIYYIFASSSIAGTSGSYELAITSCECPDVAPPSDPEPRNGARGVSTSVVLSWNGGAPPEGGGAAVLANLIYGADDRLDEYQVTDPALLAAGDSTAAVIGRVYLTYSGGHYLIGPSPTFTQHCQAIYGAPLCADEPFRNQPASAWCSAFLVAPDIMATSGECIESDADCSGFAFVFGFVMLDSSTPVLAVDASQVYFCDGIIGREVGDADWCLIRLDRPVKGHAPLPIRRMGQIPDARRVTVVGHPSGLPRKYAGGGNTTVRDNSAAEYFQANLDTYGGNSGSAVFDQNTLEVEGILVRGNPDFVIAADCVRSNVCPDTGCPTWEQVTRTTAFSWMVPLYDVYDVYLGMSFGALVKVAEGLSAPWHDPRPLQPGTTYRWRVVARNTCGAGEGPIWSFTTAAPVFFVRADANADGTVDLSDAIATLQVLFIGAAVPECLAASDANGDDVVDLSDAVYTLGWLFIGSNPPPPYPTPTRGQLYSSEDCGEDRDGGADCASFTPCAGA